MSTTAETAGVDRGTLKNREFMAAVTKMAQVATRRAAMQHQEYNGGDVKNVRGALRAQLVPRRELPQSVRFEVLAQGEGVKSNFEP